MGSPITVRQLKEFVRDLPETDPEGDDYEVWILTEQTLSNVAVSLERLNKGDVILGFDHGRSTSSDERTT